MQTDYEELLPVLNSQPEIEVLVNPFITAYQNDAMEQLEGQVASAKIGMARLASPQLYWVLSGNDFTLDINNPKHPKIVCMGNNPEKQQIYGAVLSLYISRLVRQVNRRGMLKSSLIFDEFPTIYFNNMDSLIATARSNQVATTLAMQDFSQLRKDYGKEKADVIINIAGNIISGQVMGETSKLLSERFGKIMQDRQSVSINRTDTGRKNYLFAGSHEGAKRAAIIYSFFAMCKVEKVNPAHWLKYVLDNIQNTKINQLENLYPKNFKELGKM